MNSNPIQPNSSAQFNHFEHLYLRITLIMLAVSAFFLLIGVVLVKSITAPPELLIHLVTFYLYAHIVHFTYGFIRLFKFIFSPTLRRVGAKIWRTLVAIVLSPISALAAYLALFLLAMASCSA